MMEIWQELSNFQTTSQRLADQVRTIIKKGWFSDLLIIKIHQKVNDQCSNNTLAGTSNINKQNQAIRKKQPTPENGNPIQPNTAQPNNPEQTLSQEQKLNLKNLKRIMNSGKTTIPSLRNIEWRIVKAETNKVNQVLLYITTNNIKITLRENWDPIKKHERKIKTRMGISTRN